MPSQTRKSTKILRKIGLDHNELSTNQIRIICVNVAAKLTEMPIALLVTSPRKIEQKSQVTSKLAIAFAEQGKKVLLVEGNLRNPMVHHCFQAKNTFGLTHVMLEDRSIQQCVQRTIYPHLYVLTSGFTPQDYQRFFVPAQLERVVSHWKKYYDVIIFDGAPYLSTSDAQMIGHVCDGTILVCKQNVTRKEDALKTRAALEKANDRLLGVIYQTK